MLSSQFLCSLAQVLELSVSLAWEQVGIFSLSEYWELLLTWCLCRLSVLFWLLTSLLACAAKNVRKESRLFFRNAGSPYTSQDFPLVDQFEDPHLVLTFRKGSFPSLWSLWLTCARPGHMKATNCVTIPLCKTHFYLPHSKCQPCLTMSMLPAWRWLSSSWMCR